MPLYCITLIIKGTEQEAQAACDARGIEAKCDDLLTRLNHMEAKYRLFTDNPKPIIDWFCEPFTAPCPAGTLLWYSMDKDVQ